MKLLKIWRGDMCAHAVRIGEIEMTEATAVSRLVTAGAAHSAECETRLNLLTLGVGERGDSYFVRIGAAVVLLAKEGGEGPKGLAVRWLDKANTGDGLTWNWGGALPVVPGARTAGGGRAAWWTSLAVAWRRGWVAVRRW